jgi:hypothetical protein
VIAFVGGSRLVFGQNRDGSLIGHEVIRCKHQFFQRLVKRYYEIASGLEPYVDGRFSDFKVLLFKDLHLVIERKVINERTDSKMSDHAGPCIALGKGQGRQQGNDDSGLLTNVLGPNDVANKYYKPVRAKAILSPLHQFSLLRAECQQVRSPLPCVPGARGVPVAEAVSSPAVAYSGYK